MSKQRSLNQHRAVAHSVRGTVTVSLSVHEAADSFVRDPSTGKPQGYRLRDLQARAKQGKITVTDPHRGDFHTLSIDHLSGFDPDATYVIIHYRFTPDDPIEYTRRAREVAAAEPT